MTGFKEFQRNRQSVGVVLREPYKCCACNKPFRNDATPEINHHWDAITCPYCMFRQSVAWAKPGHFTCSTKQRKFAHQQVGR